MAVVGGSVDGCGNGSGGSGDGRRAVGAKLFIPPLYSKFLKLKDDLYR